MNTTVKRYIYQKNNIANYPEQNNIDKYIIALVKSRNGLRYIIDKQKLDSTTAAISKDIVKSIQNELNKVFKN